AAGVKYDCVKASDAGFLDGYVISTNKEPGETINVEQGEILTITVCDNSLLVEAYVTEEW
ncbi:MAG: hypothetical protein RR540_07955, partial [Oscillospiraceae bacterium]